MLKWVTVESYPLPVKKEPNPETMQKHRRETLWQITVPAIAGAGLLLLLAVLASLGKPAGVSQRADTSLIFLIIPNLLCSFIFLVLLAAITYGLIRLIAILPGYTRQLQDFFKVVNQKVKEVMDVLTEPVLRVHGLRASLEKLYRGRQGNK